MKNLISRFKNKEANPVKDGAVGSTLTKRSVPERVQQAIAAKRAQLNLVSEPKKQ